MLTLVARRHFDGRYEQNSEYSYFLKLRLILIYALMDCELKWNLMYDFSNYKLEHLRESLLLRWVSCQAIVPCNSLLLVATVRISLKWMPRLRKGSDGWLAVCDQDRRSAYLFRLVYFALTSWPTIRTVTFKMTFISCLDSLE